jgi:hypothetical protein
MKNAWVWICIPPVAGLLVFLLVWSSGSVRVPTQKEIDAAPSKLRTPAGRTTRQPDPKKFAEWLANQGYAQPSGSGSNSGSSGQTRSQSTTPEPSGPFREDLEKQRADGSITNHNAYIHGIAAGIVVAALGYGVAIFMFYQQFKTRSNWQGALAARQAVPGARASAGPLVQQMATATLSVGEAVAQEPTKKVQQPPPSADSDEIVFVDEEEARSEFEVEEGIQEDRTG